MGEGVVAVCFSVKFIRTFRLHMCTHVDERPLAHIWRSENNLWESVLLLHPVSGIELRLLSLTAGAFMG